MGFQCNRGQRKVQLDRWLGFGGSGITLPETLCNWTRCYLSTEVTYRKSYRVRCGSWLLILHYMYQDFPLALKSQHMLQ